MESNRSHWLLAKGKLKDMTQFERGAVAAANVLFLLIVLSVAAGIDGRPCLCDVLFDSNSRFNFLFASAAVAIVLGGLIGEPFYVAPATAFVNAGAALFMYLSVDPSWLGGSPRSDSAFDLLSLAPKILLILAVLLVAVTSLVAMRRSSDARSGVHGVCYSASRKFGSSFCLLGIGYALVAFIAYWGNPPVLLFLLAPLIPVLTLYPGCWALKFLRRHCPEADGAPAARVRRYGRRIVVADFEGKMRDDLRKGAEAGTVLVARVSKDRYVPCRIVSASVLLNGFKVTGAVLEGYLERSRGLKDILASGKSMGSPDALILSAGKVAEPVRAELASGSSGSLSPAAAVGLVDPGSGSRDMSVSLFPWPSMGLNSASRVGGGSILSAEINGSSVLYQVASAETAEADRGDSCCERFVRVRANKIGIYDEETRSLEPSNWVPMPDSLAFLVERGGEGTDLAAKDCKRALGVLPHTSYPIEIKDPKVLITNNVAISGQTGSGKTRVAQRIVKMLWGGSGCRKREVPDPGYHGRVGGHAEEGRDHQCRGRLQRLLRAGIRWGALHEGPRRLHEVRTALLDPRAEQGGHRGRQGQQARGNGPGAAELFQEDGACGRGAAPPRRVRGGR